MPLRSVSLNFSWMRRLSYCGLDQGRQSRPRAAAGVLVLTVPGIGDAGRVDARLLARAPPQAAPLVPRLSCRPSRRLLS